MARVHGRESSRTGKPAESGCLATRGWRGRENEEGLLHGSRVSRWGKFRSEREVGFHTPVKVLRVPEF